MCQVHFRRQVESAPLDMFGMAVVLAGLATTRELPPNGDLAVSEPGVTKVFLHFAKGGCNASVDMFVRLMKPSLPPKSGGIAHRNQQNKRRHLDCWMYQCVLILLLSLTL